jgi:hypothetical protein
MLRGRALSSLCILHRALSLSSSLCMMNDERITSATAGVAVRDAAAARIIAGCVTRRSQGELRTLLAFPSSRCASRETITSRTSTPFDLRRVRPCQRVSAKPPAATRRTRSAVEDGGAKQRAAARAAAACAHARRRRSGRRASCVATCCALLLGQSLAAQQLCRRRRVRGAPGRAVRHTFGAVRSRFL